MNTKTKEQQEKEASELEFTTQIEAKVIELKEKYNKEVYPIVIVHDGAKRVAYMGEPTIQAKMAAFDKMAMEQSLTTAGEMIFSMAMLEESDPVFSSTDSRYDEVKIGAYLDCTRFVKILANTYKKK